MLCCLVLAAEVNPILSCECWADKSTHNSVRLWLPHLWQPARRAVPSARGHCQDNLLHNMRWTSDVGRTPQQMYCHMLLCLLQATCAARLHGPAGRLTCTQ